MGNKKQVTIIGPYGEIGGVSIHIKRLTELLAGEFQFIIVNESRIPRIENNIINFRKLPIGKYLSAVLNSELVHIHSGKNLLVTFHLIVAFFLHTKSIVTLHSYKNPSALFNFVLKLMPFRIVVVSKEIRKNLKMEKSMLLNAFIPAISEQNEILDESVSNLIMDNKNQGKYIITGNAFRLAEYNNGDLYGADQLIKLAVKLKAAGIKALIVFFVGSLIKCAEKYQAYCQQIKELDIESHILLLNKTVPFIKVIEIADLVVRPTLTDGDALTIREAIHYNKPVIASDVVERPQRTILYKTADVDDLFRQVKFVMSNDLNSDTGRNKIEEYKNIYQEIYETSNSEL